MHTYAFAGVGDVHRGGLWFDAVVLRLLVLVLRGTSAAIGWLVGSPANSEYNQNCLDGVHSE